LPPHFSVRAPVDLPFFDATPETTFCLAPVVLQHN
jgi:hypothetical protein